jgi:hypothetical protein
MAPLMPRRNIALRALALRRLPGAACLPPAPSCRGNDRRESGRQGRDQRCAPCVRCGLRDLPRAIRSDALSICGLNQRPRLLFQANLLRFPAISSSLAHDGRRARDWREKTENWQVETSRGARSLLAGGNTFIEQLEAEVAL